MGSNAVSQNAVSSIVGFTLGKGYFNPSSPNLPQSIAILGQANTANQSGLSTDPVQLTSAAHAASLYGYGSPIHAVARILFPQSGGGVGVPVFAYPQLAAAGGAAKVITVTPTGTATANGTVYLVVGGRYTLDGASYAINIVTGDTPTVISGKMRTAVAAALGCPVTGSGTTTFVGTAKYVGLESDDITISIDTNNTSTGVTFAVASTTPGTGTASVAASLALFGNRWHTVVINTYGMVTTTMDELELFNGIPDPLVPTGRYQGPIWRPFLAFTGTVADDPTSITDARANNLTIVPAVAPKSAGLPYEAAANAAYLFAKIAQDAPHLDTLGYAYPDMPAAPAGSIPLMNTQSFRETCVQKGCSTVDYTDGKYSIVDLVTTYHKVGEAPPFYRYPRDMNIHFNKRYSYHLREIAKLIGKTITKDDGVVTAKDVMKPKMWAAEVADMIDDWEKRALITDAKFSKSTISVTINPGNPNRLDTEFSDKLTGIVRISSTTNTSGFNFSN